MLVNWFEIDYYDTYFAENDQLFFNGQEIGASEFHVDGFSTPSIEVYDLTTPNRPVRITGGTVAASPNGQQLAFETTIANEHNYLAQTSSQRLSPLSISQDTPSSWNSPGVGADYIIISHASFMDQVQPLAAYRASQGLRVQIVDVQDLYDEFNDGIFSPEAIKAFLTYAYANWTAPAPSFVLLVGDGHLDYKNNFGWNTTNYIPPYLDDVDPWIGETATDNRFVSVSGNDILPDMHIGRFPAQTAIEAQTMVQKTISYEQIAPVGDWNARQLFVADKADSAGDFAALSDQIIDTYIPDSYTIDKIYYNINYTDPSLIRNAVINAINQGRLIVHYVGHASTQQWGAKSYFSVTSMPSLTNGSKLPLMLPMTCQEGYFIWPQPPSLDYSSLGESIVRKNGGGAIASWSPTGFGLNTGHSLMDESLFNDLFNNQLTQLGYLTTNAKYNLYAAASGYEDLIETYVLFGDPALSLQKLPGPVTNYIYMPFVIDFDTVPSLSIDIWPGSDNMSGWAQGR